MRKVIQHGWVLKGSQLVQLSELTESEEADVRRDGRPIYDTWQDARAAFISHPAFQDRPPSRDLTVPEPEPIKVRGKRRVE